METSIMKHTKSNTSANFEFNERRETVLPLPPKRERTKMLTQDGDLVKKKNLDPEGDLEQHLHIIYICFLCHFQPILKMSSTSVNTIF